MLHLTIGGESWVAAFDNAKGKISRLARLPALIAFAVRASVAAAISPAVVSPIVVSPAARLRDGGGV
jgi:hypothetical protein